MASTRAAANSSAAFAALPLDFSRLLSFDLGAALFDNASIIESTAFLRPSTSSAFTLTCLDFMADIISSTFSAAYFSAALDKSDTLELGGLTLELRPFFRSKNSFQASLRASCSSVTRRCLGDLRDFLIAAFMAIDSKSAVLGPVSLKLSVGMLLEPMLRSCIGLLDGFRFTYFGDFFLSDMSSEEASSRIVSGRPHKLEAGVNRPMRRESVLMELEAFPAEPKVLVLATGGFVRKKAR
mmetsp:Transcript_11091/g.16971  ORF Transcript_11091/g.16971 Transcript_11091/m.16971 type:complete len:239 (-) Transcript_11091:1304-2020(-)